MQIGFPGKLLEIPFPATGMGFASNNDVEVTELDNGARHVRNAPVSFKTFNMSWRAKTPSLQPLVDLYNRRYGNRSFYLLDPNLRHDNMLPARWASAYQLAHTSAGQGQPLVVTEGRIYPQVVFNGKGWTFAPPSVRLILTKGRDHYFKAWGSRTGIAGVQYRTHNPTTLLWGAWTTVAPTMAEDAPVKVVQASQTMAADFIEFRLNVPNGDTLTLEHMDFSTEDYRAFEDKRRPGNGVGALRFTNTLDGELVSARIQRIGLSVDMTEVEYISG